MQGEVGGWRWTCRLPTAARLLVLITSVVKTDASGEPILVRTTVFERATAVPTNVSYAGRGSGGGVRLQQLVALQQSLLPGLPWCQAWTRRALPDRSADEVGGDFTTVPLSEDRWGVALGDVCGKGATPPP